MFDKENLLKAIDKKISQLRNETQLRSEKEIIESNLEQTIIFALKQCRVEELWLLKMDIENGEFDI